MTPMQFAGNFDLKVYNGLSEVGAADCAVRRNGSLDTFLDAAGSLIGSYDMEDRFGVALLHGHYRCMAGERMIEFEEDFGDRRALVTRPVGELKPADHATPTVWSLEGDRFCPLEFTTDSDAARLFNAADIPDDFIDAYRDLVQASPVGRLLGLSVVARGFYADAQQNEVPVEYSDLVPRGSVILLSDREAEIGHSIETAWSFKKAPGANVAASCHLICHKNGPGDFDHSNTQVHVP